MVQMVVRAVFKGGGGGGGGVCLPYIIFIPPPPPPPPPPVTVSHYTIELDTPNSPLLGNNLCGL